MSEQNLRSYCLHEQWCDSYRNMFGVFVFVIQLVYI